MGTNGNWTAGEAIRGHGLAPIHQMHLSVHGGTKIEISNVYKFKCKVY
jgi:hypothetical protein